MATETTAAIDSHNFSKSSSLTFVQRQIIAGAVGSITTTLVLNPIGVLKVRTQAGQGGLLDVAKQVVRDNGFRGFWAGSGLGLMQSIPSTVIYMTAYENFKLNMTELAHSGGCGGSVLLGAVPGLSGATARSLVVTVLAPLELMRTRALAGLGSSSGGGSSAPSQRIWSLVRNIYLTEGGVSAFYRGLGSTIMRDTPFSAVYWMSFETAKQKLYAPTMRNYYGVSASTKTSSEDAVVNFLSGSTSGALAALVTHPFDVLKTQTQTQLFAAAARATSSTPPQATSSTPPQATSSSSAASVVKCLPPGVCVRQVCSVMAECCCPCTSALPTAATESSAAAVSASSSSAAATSPPSSRRTPLTSANTTPAGAPAAAEFSQQPLSMRQGLSRIVRLRGVPGLFSGLSMRLATIIPGSGIMITVYEFAKSFDLK